ncbi:lipase member H-A-like [Adelges cooleyi]|uniref:lipase member H-A-like n=1 Tax=Adelges cooleyi TaxID=133065 RepID=UPI0021809474|nr:lipase member H-A-like [Adelges cooleyi]
MDSMDFTVFCILTVLTLLSLIGEGITLTNPVCMLRPSNIDNMKYFLYTKNRLSRLAVDEDTIKHAPFVNSRSLIIIIHGYTERYDDPYVTTLRTGYLNGVANRNVVLVDYSSIVANVSIFELGTLYVKLVLCDVPDIAKQVVDLVVLTLTSRSYMNHVHLIGHSLGAHIAGQVGKHYVRLTGNLVDRVTALDPAGPLFEGSPRVNTRIAKFVDVVHTNINVLGYVDPIGTVDFYINNGVIQTACLGGEYIT